MYCLFCPLSYKSSLCLILKGFVVVVLLNIASPSSAETFSFCVCVCVSLDGGEAMIKMRREIFLSDERNIYTCSTFFILMRIKKGRGEKGDSNIWGWDTYTYENGEGNKAVIPTHWINKNIPLWMSVFMICIQLGRINATM